MTRRRWFLLGTFLLVAAVMAYYLQDFIQALFLAPITYLWWIMTLFYHAIAQLIFWVLVVVVVTLMAFGSLYGRIRPKKRAEQEYLPKRGPVETVAWHLLRTKHGTYFKWLVAHRLAELARMILIQREGEGAFPNGTLKGRDWNPPEYVKTYLESGLNRSFADYPRRGRFSRLPQTPFDIDIVQVVEYLESQMETKN